MIIFWFYLLIKITNEELPRCNLALLPGCVCTWPSWEGRSNHHHWSRKIFSRHNIYLKNPYSPQYVPQELRPIQNSCPVSWFVLVWKLVWAGFTFRHTLTPLPSWFAEKEALELNCKPTVSMSRFQEHLMHDALYTLVWSSLTKRLSTLHCIPCLFPNYQLIVIVINNW